MRAKRARSFAGIILGCVLFLGLSGQGEAASILLYNENATNDNVDDALDALGLSYTVAGEANFNTLLTGSAWDLVILDVPSTLPAGGFNDLINYIAGGGSAIMSFWTLQTEAALATAFEVDQVASFNSPQDVYAWDAGHPIFAGVGTLDAWANLWGDDGDQLDALGTAIALGGFSPAPGAGQGAIVLGNGGRTIYNGFLFDEITGADGLQLIQNEITFALEGAQVPEPGVIMLLGFGAAAALRRRRS